MKGQLASAATTQEYIAALLEPRRTEIARIHELIQKTVPELKPFILNGMMAYGPYHYKYASGREGDWCRIGLASNKNYISIYTCGICAETYKSKLPKASIGKGCIRFKKLDNLDIGVLQDVFRTAASVKLGP